MKKIENLKLRGGDLGAWEKFQGGPGVDIIKYIVYFTTQVHSLLLVHLFLGNSLLSFATVLYQGPHSCLSTSAPPPSPSQSPSDLLLTVTRARKPLALPLPPFPGARPWVLLKITPELVSFSNLIVYHPANHCIHLGLPGVWTQSSNQNFRSGTSQSLDPKTQSEPNMGREAPGSQSSDWGNSSQIRRHSPNEVKWIIYTK